MKQRQFSSFLASQTSEERWILCLNWEGGLHVDGWIKGSKGLQCFPQGEMAARGESFEGQTVCLEDAGVLISGRVKRSLNCLQNGKD